MLAHSNGEIVNIEQVQTVVGLSTIDNRAVASRLLNHSKSPIRASTFSPYGPAPATLPTVGRRASDPQMVV